MRWWWCKVGGKAVAMREPPASAGGYWERGVGRGVLGDRCWETGVGKRCWETVLGNGVGRRCWETGVVEGLRYFLFVMSIAAGGSRRLSYVLRFFTVFASAAVPVAKHPLLSRAIPGVAVDK
jgi:hypothetical protein